MTIEKLFYKNEKGESIEFSANSIYHANIAKITGLSDIKNTLYTTASMGQDGDTITGNKIQKRVINISGAIKSTNKDVVLEAKRVLNKVLNPQLSAQIIYEYGTHRRIIDCRLETAPVYKRGAALLTYNIDVVCPYPFWREEEETRTDIAGWLGGFEFSLASGGLEIPQNTGIEMGRRTPYMVVAVSNNGDTATGMRVEFLADGELTNPKLVNVETGEQMAFVGLTLYEGDRLIVTTGYGNKACTIYRGEQIINALAYWDVESKFLQLETGENYFTQEAASNPDNLTVSIYMTNQYLGV